MENLRNLNDELAGLLINRPCGNCGKETAAERLQQQSRLLALPNELLLEVVSHVTDRHSLKSLISTCSGDVPLLDICSAHHAVPQGIALFSKTKYEDDSDDGNSDNDDCDDHRSIPSAGEPNPSIPRGVEYDCSTVPAKVLERFSLGMISFEAAYTTLVWLFYRGFDASLGSMTALDGTAHPRHPDHEQVVYPIFHLPRTAMLEDLDELERFMHHHKLDPSQYIATKDAHRCQCSSQTTQLPISATPKPTMDDLNKEVPCYGQIDCYRARPQLALRFFSWLDFEDATTLMNQCCMMLLDNPTNEKIYQASQFIQFLRRYGELCPQRSVYHCCDMTDFHEYEDGKYTALAATFCAHCPSSLLEMVLTDFKKQHLHVNEHNWEFRITVELQPAG